MRVLTPSDCSAELQQRLQRQLAPLTEEVASSPAAELRDLLRALDVRIEIGEATLTAGLAIAALAQQLGLADRPPGGDRLQHVRPLALRKRGRETKLVLGETARREPDPALVELLVEAHRIRQQAFDYSSARCARSPGGLAASTAPLPGRCPSPSSHRTSPRRSSTGRHPVELTASKLKQLDPGLLDWNAQRRAVGFAPSA